MFKKISITLTSLSIIFFSFVSLVATTNAQSATGTLSFSPTNITFAEGETKTISVIYTGTEISAAKIVVNVGPGLKITNFSEGDGLIFIIDSPENGEAHVGKLSEGNITSGSTLLSIDVIATGCDQSGEISYNSSEVLIPDVQMSFSSASYTIDCGGVVENNNNNVEVPATLPKTAIISEKFDKILMSSLIISSGLGIAYYIKMHRGIESPNTELIIKT